MKRCLSLGAILAVAVLSSDCGKKGPLQPPLARRPQTVKELTVVQRGDKMILRWTNPVSYLDGSPLKDIAEVEVWMLEGEKPGEGKKAEVAPEEFEKKARIEARLTKEQTASSEEQKEAPASLSFVYLLPKEKIGQRMYSFALKTKDGRRRLSELSEIVSLVSQVLSLPPQNVRATVRDDHIEICWDDPTANIDQSTPPRLAGYRIYRSEGLEPPSPLNSAPVKATDYKDKNFSFGKTYRYLVRAAASAASPYSESDDSAVVEVQAKDTFPPAAPAGLTAIAGAGFIALSWEANKEADLGSYKIWRKQEGQADFVLLATLGPAENYYADSPVEKNKRYVYAITALDNAGNESQRSEPASATIREGPG